MVMMQSPISDGQPNSPSSVPTSPKYINNNHLQENGFKKFEPIRLERQNGSLLMARFQEYSSDENKIEMKNKYPAHKDQPIFTKDDPEYEPKFSIERLKQLTDHSISRLSPSDVDSNQSGKYSIDHSLKYNNGLSTAVNNSDIENHVNHQNHQLPIKYPLNPCDLDLDRLKLARTLTNGKELSDFGFRIQLGGLAANYARSDTSEELVVDGNDDSCSQDTATVSLDYVNSFS